MTTAAVYAVATDAPDQRVQPWKTYLQAEKDKERTEKARWEPEKAKPWEKPWVKWRSELASDSPETQGS